MKRLTYTALLITLILALLITASRGIPPCILRGQYAQVIKYEMQMESPWSRLDALTRNYCGVQDLIDRAHNSSN